jgi:hypothetical protein
LQRGGGGVSPSAMQHSGKGAIFTCTTKLRNVFLHCMCCESVTTVSIEIIAAL